MINIMDGLFNGMSASEFYRAQVFPELFQHEKPMLIQNWPEQDQEMYCGVSHTLELGVLTKKVRYTVSESEKEVDNG